MPRASDVLYRRSESLPAARVADQLRGLAGAVRRIGDGYRCDPETIAAQKDDIAFRLRILAQAVERGP
ncbi:MAG: hypothetical protein ACTS3R_16770 [Inquilinaceae bacterium]